MARPDDLVCPPAAKEAIDVVSANFRNGDVILTWRDIQNFITVEAGRRADEVLNILNLKEIDVIRNSLQRANTELQREMDKAVIDMKTAVAEVGVILKMSNFSEEQLLITVNGLRQVLAGDPLVIPESSMLKSALTSPISRDGERFRFNRTLFEENIKQLKLEARPDNLTSRAKIEAALRKNIAKLKENKSMLDELKRFELTLKALSFVDDSTAACPVCGQVYREGYLKHLLDEKVSTAQVAKETQSAILELSEKLATPARIIRANISDINRDISESFSIDQLVKEQEALLSWQSDLKELLETLSDPVDKYLDCRFASADIARLLAPTDTLALLDRVNTAFQALSSEPTHEQTAWDTLTRLEERIGTREKRNVDKRKAEFFLSRSESLFTEYESVRESILLGLYNRIANRFKDFYRILHEDEKEFTAQLQPIEATLDFKVDFFGRGRHPPHALHSEGHQDSMGLCLFLSLNEEITKGKSNLIVLDDVVMSIDSGHRKAICRLLKEVFPDQQFVITTHDKTWARQLTEMRVVESEQHIKLASGNVEDGPRISQHLDLWAGIQVDLGREDIPGAAFKLRRGSEEFFEIVCDALAVKVVYNSKMRWELGELLIPAKNQFRDLLKKAVHSANSWGNEEAITRLGELESQRKKIYDRCQIESWAINETVHYRQMGEHVQAGLYTCS